MKILSTKEPPRREFQKPEVNFTFDSRFKKMIQNPFQGIFLFHPIFVICEQALQFHYKAIY